MTLDYIFKTQPELLNNECVKVLILHCEDRFIELRNLYNETQKDYNDILEVFMHSEIILKEGLNSKDSLLKIGEILNR